VPRSSRVALLVVVVLAALPTAAALAAPRMPVGFYDDPSFRWSPDTAKNLAAAAKANTSIVHVLADWSQIAPTKPSDPLSGSDPAYKLSDLDALSRTAAANGLQLLVTISQTPKWANGEQTPNHPPNNLNDLRNFAQMLANRYNGTHSGVGTVTRFSIWNEPNLQLFLTPQFDGTRIVSGETYAKLFMAAYSGIKAGNPLALVAAGETSNRGRNHPSGGGSDSVAPATFAHMVSLADPNLPFVAWATHPYPTQYKLGPSQRVEYPNVALSTMTKFGVSLKQWFHRRVPIWITEYGEQTAPEYPAYLGAVSYATQAAHAKAALKLAQANPYVEMFIWFIFRDSTRQTWFSGFEKASGAKKPGYSAFASAAKNIDGQSVTVPAGKPFSVNVDVPLLANYNGRGATLGIMYRLYHGKTSVFDESGGKLAANQTVTFQVKYPVPKGKTYLLLVAATDRGGVTSHRWVAVTGA